MPKHIEEEKKPQRRDETREQQPYRGPVPQSPGQPATTDRKQPRSTTSGGMGGGNR